ncbi:GGDEF domain-containing protein [Pseudomonas citronellolis]|uniref:GGDEF domain-containing protein n=1 Tax=Pseudomonas citronellolis TaxID=53408 RepID=UPI0023E40AE3|nr:sensor domain-containing diguanylate cyclase [Pseudomonas citronellolis]MDF3932397.1 sensor domain-containing diguanylate cyclase [Pseudomonas citronellolis]
MLNPTRFFVVMMLLAFGVSLIAGWQLLTMRRDALDIANASGNNILLLVEREFHRDLDVHAQTLQTISNVIATPVGAGMSGPLLGALVYGHAAGSPDMGNLIITDARGHLLADLNHEGESQSDLSMREYFRVHAQGDYGLHLSHPFMPSYGNAGLSIALSRSLLDKDGHFVGVVAAIKDLRRLNDFVQGLDMAEGDVVSVRLLDGTPLAQWPNTPRPRTEGERQAFKAFVASGQGQYVHDATQHMQPYWHGYRRVGDYPAVVSVERARKTVFQAWLARSTVTSTMLILFNLATVVLAYRLRNQLRSRDDAESLLRTEASTDALTGLRNRRWFDEKARQEWSRHVRGGGELAVLMLDIDQFKAYNDHYGHPMGDTALAAVARQIGLGCRREEDGAARYGGEEFVVLLPNCDLAGARTVAENIRRNVEATALPHERSLRGVVTVSIGVASTSAHTVENVEALLKVADGNLYRAKEGGRNRVEG